jgi:signal transduction histidine kinase
MDRTLDTIKKIYPLPDIVSQRCLHVVNDHEILIGSSHGLYRVALGDSAKVIGKLYDKVVYSILPGDQPGEYWFATDYGLFSLNSNNQLVQFSIETGVQENEFNSNSCYRSESGKLYFGGINGITSFYPSAVVTTADPIRSYVSLVSANNIALGTFVTSNTTPWVLSHNQSNINIELLGKGRRSPSSYNYQYKIPQLRDEWITMGSNPDIRFHLPPGSYTLYYHVADRFEPNAPETNFIQWVIRPPFYKQFWFVGLSIAILICTVAYFIRAHRKRLQLKNEYEEQLSHRLQHERMRISRELHDNIGAQMATVKRSLNFLITNNEMLSSDQSLRKMKDLEVISSQLNQELRDTIWANQHKSISVGEFIDRLRHYMYQMLGQETPLRVHYDVRGDLQAMMGPFVALNLHRICQEAVNNVLKHAHARELIISFSGDKDHLEVMIADDGIGFDANGHFDGYGLHNIRHRAEQIGAGLHFGPSASGGSAITITIQPLILTGKTA